ncbi:MAG: outer membrane beta-barrel protein [Xanthobacteraceae bacterium]
MKRILIVAVASLLAAGRASAADLPVRTGPAPAYYPVATIYDWGGGYIGINGGYAFGQSNWYDAANPSGLGSSGNFNINGGLVGVTAGVSGQFGAFVLGFEGDFDWQGIRGTSNSAFCTSIITSTAIGAPPAGLSCRTASNWVGTLRARFGYAWDRVLVYGTAGGAGANVETSLNGLPVQNNAEFGWTAGGGLEWAFADNWTAKVEYLFVDLTGNVPCNHGYSCGYDAAAVSVTVPAANANINAKFNENIVRAGLNFKFGH